MSSISIQFKCLIHLHVRGRARAHTHTHKQTILRELCFLSTQTYMPLVYSRKMRASAATKIRY
jgi:hypothetical protein